MDAFLEDGEAWLVPLTSDGFEGGFVVGPFAQCVVPFLQTVKLGPPGFDDVVDGLVNTKAGKLHRAVCRGGHDAHFLEA